MNADLEEQEDELLALKSIFDSEFVRDGSKFAGEIRVRASIHADFTVVLKEGETLRQYEISFLPPLLLTFDLPGDYPSSSPPSYSLTCTWLTHTQIAALGAQLVKLYKAAGGAVVLFSWVQFLREDAMKFLDIQNVLELPSDGHISLQDRPNAASSEEKSRPHSSSADDRCCDASEACEPGVSATSGYTDPQRASIDQNELLNEGDVSACDPDDPGAQGAASVQEHRSLSDICPTPSQALLSQILIHDAAEKEKAFHRTVFVCHICLLGWLGSNCVQLSECGHVFCRACLGEFCKLQITEGSVRSVTCPQAGCTATPTPAQVRSIVGEELFRRYDRLLLQSTLDDMSDVAYCPRPSCAAAVIRDESSPVAMCSVCGFAFCVACKRTYHGTGVCRTTRKVMRPGDPLDLPDSEAGREMLWQDYATGSPDRKRLLERRYGHSLLQRTLTSGLSESWMARNSKPCPHCCRKIQKDGGCNMMTCSHCKQMFCWRCLTGFKEHQLPYTHFKEGFCTVYLPSNS